MEKLATAEGIEVQPFGKMLGSVYINLKIYVEIKVKLVGLCPYVHSNRHS